MTDYLQLVIGVAGLSLLSFYVAWTRFRIFCIRQDLFQVRDELWDKARELECFDDPAYMEVREKLNSLIRTAHKISLPVMIYVFQNCRSENAKQSLSNRSDVQATIEEATEKAAAILVRYVVYYRPFSGWLLIQTGSLVTKTIENVSALREHISRWFRGGGPHDLEVAACP